MIRWLFDLPSPWLEITLAATGILAALILGVLVLALGGMLL